jgi:hypothetical protein
MNFFDWFYATPLLHEPNGIHDSIATTLSMRGPSPARAAPADAPQAPQEPTVDSSLALPRQRH